MVVRDCGELLKTKVRIGRAVVSQTIFFDDAKAFSKKQRQFVNLPEYKEINEELLSAEHRLQEEQNLYRKMEQNKLPDILVELNKCLQTKEKLQRNIQKSEDALRAVEEMVENDTVPEGTDIYSARRNATKTFKSATDRLEATTRRIAELSEQRKKLLKEQKLVVEKAQKEYDRALSRAYSGFEQVLGEKYRNGLEAISLVKEDPEISEDTFIKLCSLLSVTNKGDWDLSYPFGISFSTISIEIQRNISQSFSELVARIADQRGLAFVDALVELYQLRDIDSLFYYVWPADGSGGLCMRPWPRVPGNI